MSWQPSREELASVQSLGGPARYAYFVKKAADWEEIWVLQDRDGYVTYADGSDRTLMPVWPHAEFARACATDDWSGADCEEVELATWLDEWTDRLTSEGTLVAVFPLADGRGVAVEPSRLHADLEGEAGRYG